jgi:hypothetical protein
METKSAGALKPSKKISAAFSRFRVGFNGASVKRTGCCDKKKTRHDLEQISSKLSTSEIIDWGSPSSNHNKERKERNEN